MEGESPPTADRSARLPRSKENLARFPHNATASAIPP